MHGAVLDPHSAAVGERTAVIVSTPQTAPEPDESMNARIVIEGISPEAEHKDIPIQVTVLRFDQ
ncbi:MAG: hypothetical protein H0T92_16340 [Pyrinomonadaceae bacterium]|nr:hypothetical protein [Pyrinomonadaceae bacterium]